MKRRQLIYIPEIEPSTFLFFYFKGDTGRSYSLRDYTVSYNPPRRTDAHQYPFTAEEILVKARYTFPADTVSTKDIDYWREQIEALNERYLMRSTETNRSGVVQADLGMTVTPRVSPSPTKHFPADMGNLASTFSIRSRDGHEICSVDDWFRLAPPKKGSHWQDGRSAKELAKAWLATGTPRMPDDLSALLKSNPATVGLVIDEAVAEMTTRLDDYRGGSRNHDLVLLGRAHGKTVLVAVEAKADEEFGRRIGEELTAGSAKPNSNIPDRIRLLSLSIFGRPIDADIESLRYQLLHGFAGALIEAKNRQADLAVFVVHEFISSETRPANIARNKADFTEFIRSFAGLSRVSVEAGRLISGIRVPGGPYVPSDVPVLIGKVVTNLGW